MLKKILLCVVGLLYLALAYYSNKILLDGVFTVSFAIGALLCFIGASPGMSRIEDEDSSDLRKIFMAFLTHLAMVLAVIITILYFFFENSLETKTNLLYSLVGLPVGVCVIGLIVHGKWDLYF